MCGHCIFFKWLNSVIKKEPFQNEYRAFSCFMSTEIFEFSWHTITRTFTEPRKMFEWWSHLESSVAFILFFWTDILFVISFYSILFYCGCNNTNPIYSRNNFDCIFFWYNYTIQYIVFSTLCNLWQSSRKKGKKEKWKKAEL